MKKQKKLLLIIFAILIFAFAFTGCSKKEEEKTQGQEQQQEKEQEYTSADNTFSIRLKGDWTQTETGKQEVILLDNQDQTLTVVVQRFFKETIKTDSGVDNLDGFIEFYKNAFMKDSIEIANKITVQEITDESMVSAKAEEIEATQNNQTSKLFNGYLESESSFYVFGITGTESIYDNNIETLKECIQTLNEK